MKNVEDLAHSNIVVNSRPPSEEKWESCRDSEYCLDAAAAMTDMVMSLASEFQQDLDSCQGRVQFDPFGRLKVTQ